MACDLKPSIERMKAKLHDIEELAFFAQADADENDKLGGKYMVLSRAIGKIAEKVRDTMPVREYWYAKFVDEGVLVTPEALVEAKRDKKCEWNSHRCGGGCLVWDDNVKMSAEILMLKSTIEAMKNGEKKEVR